MTLEERLKQAEENFNRLDGERQALLKRLEEIPPELLRLQGEHRLLTQLMKEQDDAKSG